MVVVPPIAFTNTNVTSNVAEPSPGEVVWSPTGTYVLGDEVIRIETHRKYELVGETPGTTPPEDNPTKWQDIGPTNKWTMFDTMRSSPTISASTIELTFTPGKRVDSLALLGLKSSKLTIEMKVGGDTVYGPVEKGMSVRLTTTWRQYFFGEFKLIPSFVVLDLPMYAGAVIYVTIENDSGSVEVSAAVIGAKTYLGQTQYDTVSDSLNFSRIDRDEFGNSLLKQRRTIPKVNANLMSGKSLTPILANVREQLNAQPALWSSLDDNYTDDYFNTLLIYGIYRRFEIDIGSPTFTRVNLELEEM